MFVKLSLDDEEFVFNNSDLDFNSVELLIKSLISRFVLGP